MKINFRRAALTVISAAGLSVAYSTTVDAAPLAPSIAIKFAAEQPGNGAPGSNVVGPAGVLNTATWNNFTGAFGGPSPPLTADVGGAPTATAATVTWVSNNTWSSTGAGEENNTAPAGENRDLMTGYLDTLGVGTPGVELTVANLPPVPGFNFFDMYVYIKGGVNGRGGTYTLSGTPAIGTTTLEHTGDAAFNGTFVEDTLDPGTTPGSNYIVFRGIPLIPGGNVTLTSTPLFGNPARAPINGIEIVANPVPEPSTLALLGLGVITVGGLAWRRRRES
jgi:hypothetical protein